ncbi:MAG: hypothetical protein IJ760_08630 [Bacteroidales bacterium]|nr:hypothetical protein [Bacteroidales bacterium]
MHICIFNPEHDLCLAKGRAHYVPPRSAVEFAMRDAGLMLALYPDAECRAVYDDSLRDLLPTATRITAWGWNAVVKHELLKRGAPQGLLPTDGELAVVRRLQHRGTILPLQSHARPVTGEGDVDTLLHSEEHIVLKAPWSGAGRGLRWVHGALSAIDRDWLTKTVREQGMAIAEVRQDVALDLAIEYTVNRGHVCFAGYSLFRTGSGVYRSNYRLDDRSIVRKVHRRLWPYSSRLEAKRMEVEEWLGEVVAPCYNGPLGVDLMVCRDGRVRVAEMNLRHTMGMVAHAQINKQ